MIIDDNADFSLAHNKRNIMIEKNVSVIIPIYNCERYLKKCLDSVFKQSFTNIEVICVNDGSTDNSDNILVEYANKEKRLKIIRHKCNKGLTIARNTGIEAATGKYVLFVDADDFIDREAIQMLYNKAEEKSADITIMGVRRVVLHDLIKLPFSNPSDMFDKEIIDKTLLFDKYYPKLLSKVGLTVSVIDKLYRRELFTPGYKIISGFVGEDLALNAQLFLRAKTVSYVNYIGYNWRYSGDSRKYLIQYWNELKLLYPKLINIVNHSNLSIEQKNKAIKAIAYSRLTDLRGSIIQRFLICREKKRLLEFINSELNDFELQEEIRFIANSKDELFRAACEKDCYKFKKLSMKYFMEHKKSYICIRLIDMLSK